VVIILAGDGRAKSVAIKPGTLDATPLGTCVATIFRTVAFPHGDDGRTFEVKLRRPA
jgi:hypothetical protein